MSFIDLCWINQILFLFLFLFLFLCFSFCLILSFHFGTSLDQTICWSRLFVPPGTETEDHVFKKCSRNNNDIVEHGGKQNGVVRRHISRQMVDTRYLAQWHGFHFQRRDAIWLLINNVNFRGLMGGAWTRDSVLLCFVCFFLFRRRFGSIQSLTG